MSKERIHDPSSRRGVFVGDLKYGRRNCNVVSRSDYTGENNLPVAPLKLIRPRNPIYWTKDRGIKKVSSKNSSWQQAINYLLISYSDNINKLKANYHLTIGKQRI